MRTLDLDRDLGLVTLGCPLLAFPLAIRGTPDLQQARLDAAQGGAAADVGHGTEEMPRLVDQKDQPVLAAQPVFKCRVAGDLADPELVRASGGEDPDDGLERVILPCGRVPHAHEEEIRALSGLVLVPPAVEQSAERQRGRECEQRLFADRRGVDVVHDALDRSSGVKKVLRQVIRSGCAVQ